MYLDDPAGVTPKFIRLYTNFDEAGGILNIIGILISSD